MLQRRCKGFFRRLMNENDMLSHAMATTLAIVGAGRVGRALGFRLHELGWSMGAVVTRSQATARAAVRSIGAGRAHARLTRQVLAADVVLITTADAAIAGVAGKLAQMGREEWRGKIVLHTSGALDHSVLAPLKRYGAATGSLHPLQTFGQNAAPELEGIVFVLEGAAVARRAARRIVCQLGGVAVPLDGRNKPAYHAAGAFVAGHVLAVMETATRILMRVGFTRRRAVRALLPLARETLRNFEHLGPGSAWTGPLSRGDYATLARHLQALRDFPREYRQAYVALTRLGGRVLARDARAMLRRLRRVLADS